MYMEDYSVAADNRLTDQEIKYKDYLHSSVR